MGDRPNDQPHTATVLSGPLHVVQPPYPAYPSYPSYQAGPGVTLVQVAQPDARPHHPEVKPAPVPVFGPGVPADLVTLFSAAWHDWEGDRTVAGVTATLYGLMQRVLTELERNAPGPSREEQDRRRPKLLLLADLLDPKPRDKPDKLFQRLEALGRCGRVLSCTVEAARPLKLELAESPDLHGARKDANVAGYLQLLWQLLDQGFEQPYWARQGVPPPNRLAVPVKVAGGH